MIRSEAKTIVLNYIEQNDIVDALKARIADTSTAIMAFEEFNTDRRTMKAYHRRAEMQNRRKRQRLYKLLKKLNGEHNAGSA